MRLQNKSRFNDVSCNRNNNAIVLQHGFTLLEIMVVVAIIGIILTTVTLYGFDTKTIQTKQLAKQLYSLFGLAQEKAILQSNTIGWQTQNNDFEFMDYQLKANSWQGEWQKFNHDRLLHDYPIPIYANLEYTVQSNPYSKAFQVKTDDEDNINDNSSNNNSDENTLDNDSSKTNMIIFFSNGELTPFTITIGIKNRPPIYQIVGNANGSIRLIALRNKK